MENPNPYATPTVDPIHPGLPADGLELASLGERFAGSIIDGLVNFVIVMLVFAAFFALNMVSSFADLGTLGIGSTIVLSLAAFLGFVAINWKFLSTSGQTIGKKVLKTRIVTLDGKLPPVGDLVFKRYAFMNLIGAIPFVGGLLSIVNILFIFGRERRCLHDRIAGTKVVKAPPAAL